MMHEEIVRVNRARQELFEDSVEMLAQHIVEVLQNDSTLIDVLTDRACSLMGADEFTDDIAENEQYWRIYSSLVVQGLNKAAMQFMPIDYVVIPTSINDEYEVN